MPDTIIVSPDSIITKTPPVIIDSTITDTVLMQLSKTILANLKMGAYEKLAPMIDPVAGVRFSLYAYVDTSSDKVFSQQNFQQLLKNQKTIDWGTTEAGDSILLSLAGYLKKYVYDKDFLLAPKNAVNHFLGGGNSLNNLLEVYPGCAFTEFYFPGFDPKYEGMDWETLRLVFKKDTGHVYLVGIIHDQWTI